MFSWYLDGDIEGVLYGLVCVCGGGLKLAEAYFNILHNYYIKWQLTFSNINIG